MLNGLKKVLETVKFSSVVQKTPAGDVDAIYAAL
jgi:hypothetical protein